MVGILWINFLFKSKHILLAQIKPTVVGIFSHKGAWVWWLHSFRIVTPVRVTADQVSNQTNLERLLLFVFFHLRLNAIFLHRRSRLYRKRFAILPTWINESSCQLLWGSVAITSIALLMLCNLSKYLIYIISIYIFISLFQMTDDIDLDAHKKYSISQRIY